MTNVDPGEVEASKAVAAALDEVAALLVQLRGEGSSVPD
jgi:hypothetical protein